MCSSFAFCFCSRLKDSRRAIVLTPNIRRLLARTLAFENDCHSLEHCLWRVLFTHVFAGVSGVPNPGFAIEIETHGCRPKVGGDVTVNLADFGICDDVVALAPITL